MREVTLAEVVADYDVADAIGYLTTALERTANGNTPKRTARATQQAAKLRAILALI